MRINPRNWSLATKWSLMLTALALAPLLVVIRLSHDAAATKILEKSVMALSNGASDGAGGLEDALSERVRQAQFLAGLPIMRKYLETPQTNRVWLYDELDSIMQSTQKAYPYIESLDLISAQGLVIYSTSGRGSIQKEGELLTTVVSGKVYMAGLKPQDGKNEPSLVIAAPVATGLQGGAIRLQSSPQFLTARVAREGGRQGTGTLGLLLDDERDAIARSDNGTVGEKISITADGQLTMPDGTQYHAQQARLQSLPWTYAVALPIDVLANELNAQRTQSLLLALAASLVTGVLARFLAVRFTRPVVKMADATRALAEGDLTYVMQPSSQNDEVGQLQNAFDEAYKQLRRLVARMRLSSHLVAEASEHLHSMTAVDTRVSGTVAAASEKLSVVAKDLERQVAHFRI